MEDGSEDENEAQDHVVVCSGYCRPLDLVVVSYWKHQARAPYRSFDASSIEGLSSLCPGLVAG